jgi:hypothetical protein
MNPGERQTGSAAGMARGLETNRWILWFGLLGGGVAWLLHFLISYAAGEFGCLSGFGERLFLGINWVAWIVIATTVVMLGIALTATVLAYRGETKLMDRERELKEDREWEKYMAHAGWITSGLFALIILVEALPILYFLKDC